jgi:hypothetical protein
MLNKFSLSLSLSLLLSPIPLFLGACADDEARYAGVEFKVLSSPPSPVSFESDRVELVEGVAVKVQVIPHSSSDVDYRGALLSMRGDDRDKVEVYSTEVDNQFVLVGSEAGATCLTITIDRDEKECIDLRVLPAVAE